jgi:hypothetical protein
VPKNGRTFRDRIDADSWLLFAFDGWARALDPVERAAVDSYKGEAHRLLNAALRAREPLSDEQMALRDGLDAALALGEVPEDVVVYRGATPAALPGPTESMVGAAIIDRGYASTSLLERVAGRFAAPLLMRILVPAGAEAVPCGAPDLVVPVDESELLLGRETVFRVNGFLAAGAAGKPTVDLKVIL